jgi:hypothetical protein
MNVPCSHPNPPELCLLCDKEAVASINCVGACVEHLDAVFQQAAAPLTRLLMAANAVFAADAEADADVAP